MAVRQLPHGVVKLISSTQVISSVSSVVKELLENAIDAGASVIDIKLEKYGLDKIEVRDNGYGINTSDVYHVCLPSYTSKIYSLEDLETLRSYGFRGEALNSLCAVSQLFITTRTESDEIASTYTFDNNGTVREVKPSHQMKGTIVTVTNLFRNVPVRKQFYENTRKATEELKRIEKVVKMLSVIHPKLRVTIAHNKCLIWHKTSVNTLRQSLMQVYPHVVLKNLEYFNHSFDELSVELLICKRDCNWSVLCQPANEAVLFFVNKRPVKDKKVEQVVLEEMVYLFASALPNNKCPLTLISITLPPQDLDVNLEPDKSKVFIKNHEDVLKQIRECIMLHFYKQPLREEKPDVPPDVNSNCNGENAAKKRKLDRDIEDVELNPKALVEVPSTDRNTVRSDELSLNVENVTPNIDRLNELPEHEGNSVLVAEPSDDVLDDMSDFDLSLLDDGIEMNSTKSETSPGSRDKQSDLKPVVYSEYMNHTDVVCGEQTVDLDTSVNEAALELSIPGDLAADLFASQSAENVEIYFKSPTVPNSDNKSTTAELSTGKTESPAIIHESVAECNNTNVLSFLNEDVEELENEFNVNLDANGSKSKSIVESTSVNTSLNKNLSQATLSQWSKGHVIVEDQLLQGASVLTSSKVNDMCKEERTKESSSLVERKNVKLPHESQPDAMERSISSQMGRKDLAGLTNFARSVRPEIIKENPGISFSKVASELASRWRNLGETQKTAYAEKAKAAKNQKTAASTAKTRPLIKKQSIIVSTSVNLIAERLQSLKDCSTSNDVRLIGPLQTKNEWLCRIGELVMAVHVPHLQENVLFHRYLCHSSIPLGRLDEPIRITNEIVGNELWTFLLSLEKSHDNDLTSFISDARITKNGFRVVVREFCGMVEVLLTEAAKESSFQPIENLVETLQLAILHKDLQHCRSAAIKRILREKVAAACEERKTLSDAEIEMLVQYWVQSMAQQKSYSERPVSVNLHRLRE